MQSVQCTHQKEIFHGAQNKITDSPSQLLLFKISAAKLFTCTCLCFIFPTQTEDDRQQRPCCWVVVVVAILMNNKAYYTVFCSQYTLHKCWCIDHHGQLNSHYHQILNRTNDWSVSHLSFFLKLPFHSSPFTYLENDSANDLATFFHLAL